MGNVLADAAEWLAGQLQAHVAQEVTYIRGDDQLILQATIGTTEFQIEDVGGIRIEYSDRDFIIPAASLVFADQVVEPRRGDQIQESGGADGATLTYEVMAPGDAQPFRYDAFRKMLRIHAKRVSVET